MIQDAPLGRHLLPDGGTAGQAVALGQRVGEQIRVGAEAATAEVGRLPAEGVGVGGLVGFEMGKNEGGTVAPAGGADLPIAWSMRRAKSSDVEAKAGRWKMGSRGASSVRMDRRSSGVVVKADWLTNRVGAVSYKYAGACTFRAQSQGAYGADGELWAEAVSRTASI